ncbi:MAG: hypothetical protein QQN46_07935, partial [Nitrosopumilus sp.]
AAVAQQFVTHHEEPAPVQVKKQGSKTNDLTPKQIANEGINVTDLARGREEGYYFSKLAPTTGQSQDRYDLFGV